MSIAKPLLWIAGAFAALVFVVGVSVLIVGVYLWKRASTEEDPRWARIYYNLRRGTTLPPSTTVIVFRGKQEERHVAKTNRGDDPVYGSFYIPVDGGDLVAWTSSQSPAPVVSKLDEGKVVVHDDGTWSFDDTAGVMPDMWETLRSSFHSPPSPDGEWYAFAPYGNATEPTDLFVARRDGSERKRVFGVGKEQKIHGVAWFPDGKRLLVLVADYDLEGEARAQGKRKNKLLVINRDGTGAVEVHHDTDPSDSTLDELQFLPDGHTVVYARRRDLLATDVTAKRTRTLATGPEDAVIQELLLAPDGSRIAFRQARIYVVDSAGGTPAKVSPDELTPRWLIWDPRSTTVYFGASVPSSECISGIDWQVNSSWTSCIESVYSVAADGSGLRRLTDKHVEPDPVGFLTR